jgi:hypothetical protein
MATPDPTASHMDWVEYAAAQGLDRAEANSLSRDELVEIFADDDPDPEEVAYQDQGSLDAPTQVTDPGEPAEDVGTQELRDEARSRLSGVNQPRKPFPWEAPRKR